MSDKPYIVVTVLVDSSARAASITRSHGDAIERAMNASQGESVAGIELCELPIAPKAFGNLRKALNLSDDTVALYDVFPLSPSLDTGLRNVAGQFLAAEALWALEAQGMTAGVPPAEKLSLPQGWSKDPKDIRKKLVDAGAHDLSATGIEAYKNVKSRWDSAQQS